MHEDRTTLEAAIPRIRDFLRDELKLELHPKKILLRPVRDGFPFLGGYVKPNRTYVGNRTKGNFSEAVAKWNRLARPEGLPESDRPAFLASVNSYLGLLGHFDAYRLKKKFVRERLGANARKGFRTHPKFEKIAKSERPGGNRTAPDPATTVCPNSETGF